MAASSQQATMETYLENINHHLAHDWFFTLLAPVGVVLAYQIIQSSRRRSRLIASLNSEAHHYFSIPAQWYAVVKNHILYAPLLSWNLAKLPTRFQALFLTAVIGANAGLCCYDVPYGDPELDVLGILRSRTGTIAVANLIPIIVMSTVKNPLINILHISYDSLNLMHRWFGRIAIIEAALHTACHITSVVQQGGWASFAKSIPNPTIWTGLGAISAFILILVQSISIVRRTFYEAFLHLHIILVAAALVLIWMHLEAFPQRSIVFACTFLWAGSRLLRLVTLLYRSIGRTPCTATIEALPRDTVRVTITTPRPWTYKPGQHVYITIPTAGLWTAHPFSVAWSDESFPALSRPNSITTNHDVEKAIQQPYLQIFSFVVRARNGFTKRLHAHATKHAPAHLGHRVPVRALLEGPYGLSASLDSYGTVLLIAGGVGITHHLGYIRHLIQGYNDKVIATRKVTLIWVVRTEADKECVGEWMNEILMMEGRREVFSLEIWVTRDKAVVESRSPSCSLFVRRGRPDLEGIVRREAGRRVGVVGVSVCGPRGLREETRRAVRRVIADGKGGGNNVEFQEEAFGW
jgi:predicted ferric reductase